MAGCDETINTNRTPNAFARAHAFFVILACAILGFASRTEASPFMLDLVSSGSSGGGGGHAHSQTAGVGAALLGLRVGGPVGRNSSTGGSQITEPTPTTVLSSSSSYTSVAAGSTVETLTAAMQTSVASLAAPGNLAHLELGNGQTLSVSRAVVGSIVSSVSGSNSTASAGTANAIAPSQPHTDGVLINSTRSGAGDGPGGSALPSTSVSGGSAALPGTSVSGGSALPNTINAAINGGIQGSLESIAPAEIVTAAFTDIVSGIVATPSGIADPSSPSDLADDPVHAPEPATLILFASGLALTARRLRRRR